MDDINDPKYASLKRKNIRAAKAKWPEKELSASLGRLREFTSTYRLSVLAGDIIWLNGHWYVTHTGLLAVARRNRCIGIDVRPVEVFCDPRTQHWAFKATVYKSKSCRGFVGFGDADPSNVSALVRGAEMRVAETRAVNRALRKAYGIGICSVEELGAYNQTPVPSPIQSAPKSQNGENGGGPRLRDQLCQIIRQHELDPILVKSYAADFCGTKTLREATREQIEGFVAHLADWAEKDRNALLCQLNSYLQPEAGAA
jgi:hypothetical protein